VPGRLVVVRHGETEWSRAGRHTGRSDIALTRRGEQEAELVGPTLAGWNFDAAYSSPLERARETARIAGYDVTLDDDLLEWDYGEMEGLTTDQLISDRPAWSKWRDDVVGGEKPADVGRRADRFLDRLGPLDGDAVVFAHGHLLSILIARWLDLDAIEGRRFPLATATATVLAHRRGDRVLETLNHRCGPALDAMGAR